MTTGDTPDQQLADAVRLHREADGLAARLASARQQAAASATAASDAHGALTAEQHDVDEQESLSWPRILSTLRGSHATDLEREGAERDAARYAAATADARVAADQREVEALESQLAGLGDVEATYAAALSAKEGWLQQHDPATGSRLAAVAEQSGVLRAEDKEAAEAVAAGDRAHQLLAAAEDLLGSAQSWSSWDTFGGGGFLTDMVKHQRLEEVQRVLADADRALQSFSRELADLNRAGVASLAIPEVQQFFDVWFDNIFSDLAVRDRIVTARRQVQDTLTQVGETITRLEARRASIGTRLTGLAAEREQVLTT